MAESNERQSCIQNIIFKMGMGHEDDAMITADSVAAIDESYRQNIIFKIGIDDAPTIIANSDQPIREFGSNKTKKYGDRLNYHLLREAIRPDNASRSAWISHLAANVRDISSASDHFAYFSSAH